LWSDTGDLVDQLADEEDPLRLRARISQEEHNSAARTHGRRPRRVRDQREDDYESKEGQSGVVKRKEDIVIPTPRSRQISAAERILAAIMAPGDGPSRMHGLHGKKLM